MPKSVDVDVKRNEFIEASAGVIAQQGLSAATMRRIAEEAGCTTGSLTHYFSNHGDILLRTLRHVHASAGARMIAAISAATTHEEKLRSVLKESLPLDSARLREWRVWLAFWSASMDDQELTKENARRYREWLGLVESLLEPLMAKASIAIEAKRMVSLVDGLGVGLARQRASTRALASAQRDCESILAHHIEVLISRSPK